MSSAHPVRTYATKRRHSLKGEIEQLAPERESTDPLSSDDERPRKRKVLRNSPSGNSREKKYGARTTSQSPQTVIGPKSGEDGNLTPPRVPVSENTPISSLGRARDGLEKNGEPGPSNWSVGLGGGVRHERETHDDHGASYSPPPRFATPKKNPKDLSDIFNTVSPRSRQHSHRSQGHGTPGRAGLVKKMLLRSRTESSIDTTPPQALKRTPKSQSFVETSQAGPSSIKTDSSVMDSKRVQSRTPEPTESPVPAGSQANELSNSKRTYAGKSRSFLVALPASSSLTSRLGHSGEKVDTLDDDEEILRDSYTELRKRWGVDNSEGDAQHGPHDDSNATPNEGLYNPLHSITDLRSKGESRRFTDEVGYMFEGLAPTGGLGVRRSTALDILTNLCNHEFWKKTKAAGLLSEIWDQLRGTGAGSGDKILDPILCSFVSLASVDPRDVSVLANKNDFIETIIRLLGTYHTRDPFVIASASNGKSHANLDKAEAAMLKRLREVIVKDENIVKSVCQPSVRLLLSNVFAAVPSLGFPHLTDVLDSVNADLSGVSSRLAAYKSGLPIFPDKLPREWLCLGHIHNCLVFLDSYLINAENTIGVLKMSTSKLQRLYKSLATSLIALVTTADIINQTSESDELRLQAYRCSELAFRVLINLTNSSKDWCNLVSADQYAIPTILRLIVTSYRAATKLSTKKVVLENDDSYATSMDRLCLALALLTNLVQERKDMSNLLQDFKIDSSCGSQRACLLGCRCTNGVTAMTGLVNLYVSLLKDEDEMEPGMLFLRGHMSVLLGLLALQGSPRTIVDDLPGSTATGKLDGLIDNISQFSQAYATLTRRPQPTVDSDALSDALPPSSPLHAQSSHALGSDRDAASVVAEVVTSLKSLRDIL